MTPYGMGIVSRTEPQADDVAAAIDIAAALQLQAACDTRWGGERDSTDERVPVVCEAVDSASPGIAPVPTAMVAAQERSSAVEQRTPNAPVGSSNPSVPAISPDVEQWRGMVESIFPAFAVETAMRIMRCESSGNPNATGAAGEMGLFQIHPRWHPDATYDPYGNMLAAFRISGGGTSWSAWSCR